MTQQLVPPSPPSVTGQETAARAGRVLRRSRVPGARWAFRASVLFAAGMIGALWWVMRGESLHPRTCPEPLDANTVMGSFAAVVLVLAALMSLAARRVRSIPTENLNVPYPEFWLVPQREPCARRRVEDDLWWFGAWLMVLLAGLALATWHSQGKHSMGPGEEWNALVGMSVLLALGTLVRRGFYGRTARAGGRDGRSV
ncbi:hypothetical protein [Nocardioides yefusunii]|uniref:Uncharacterized protein n=1 Tax=Nocardioides yefusunii TaxID=2500546 RepID=A0ABW1QZZ1_9ACTN|nr:hypothetical protein [Nocardioides yefusunii]